MRVIPIVVTDQKAGIEHDHARTSLYPIHNPVDLFTQSLVPRRKWFGLKTVEASGPLHRGVRPAQKGSHRVIDELPDSLAVECRSRLQRPIGGLIQVANGDVHRKIVTQRTIVCNVCVESSWRQATGLRNNHFMPDLRPLAAITGASSGFGATFAQRLARNGYDLLLIARRKDRLEKLAAELPTTVEVMVADLVSDADLNAVAARLAAETRLDLLINNAGFGTRGHFWEADSQIEMHKLHVIATATLARAALQSMTARRRGAIINVASVAGFMQNPANVSYCATKCWINSFSEGLWLEMKSEGLPVRIQSLCPGFTYTEFHDVMGVDRGAIPKGWWMSAEFVVDESLKALERDELFVVPGWRYKFIVWLFSWLPRSLHHAIMLKWGSRSRKT